MRTLLALTASLLAGAAWGQATKPDAPISSARPSFSDTPQIVPVGHLQIESGVSYFSRGPSDPGHSQFGEWNFRYGLRPNVELRIDPPNYQLGEGDAPDGFDNTTIAASIYLGRLGGWDLGVIPGVVLPSGAEGWRRDSAAPSVLLNLQHALGDGVLGATLGGVYGHEEGRDVTDGSFSVVYSRNFGARTQGFVEYAGQYDRLDEPEHYAHVGLQFLTTRTTQFDIHGGVGMGGAAHAFVGAGYSVRF